MKRTAWGWGVVAVLAVGTVPASPASMPSSLRAGTEDDLAVVKRAVAASTQTAEPTGRPRTPEPARTAPDTKKKDQPQWLRVRVVDKGTKKGKVSINLPLALVRAIGDDLPLDFDCGHRDREDVPRSRRVCTIKITDVLKSLESGQELVEVDDDEATVRIWVE